MSITNVADPFVCSPGGASMDLSSEVHNHVPASIKLLKSCVVFVFGASPLVVRHRSDIYGFTDLWKGFLFSPVFDVGGKYVFCVFI